MSDFSARKQPPVISVSSDAKSKKLEETLEKLSNIKAERKSFEEGSSFPSVSAKKTDGDSAISDSASFSVKKGSGLSLRVTSAPKEETKKEETTADAVTQPEKSENQDNTIKAVGSSPMITIEKKEPKEEAKPVFDPLPTLSLEEDKAVDKIEKTPENKDFIKGEMFEGDADNEPVLMLSPGNGMPSARSRRYKITNFIGTSLTAGWFMLAGYYVQDTMGVASLVTQQPHILGGFLAGILAPVALLWMILAYIQRGSDTLCVPNCRL